MCLLYSNNQSTWFVPNSGYTKIAAKFEYGRTMQCHRHKNGAIFHISDFKKFIVMNKFKQYNTDKNGFDNIIDVGFIHSTNEFRVKCVKTECILAKIQKSEKAHIPLIYKIFLPGKPNKTMKLQVKCKFERCSLSILIWAIWSLRAFYPQDVVF